MLTRRQLFRAFGGVAVLAAIGCGDNLVPQIGPFTPAQRHALGVFADVIIPPDEDPGGQALGAVTYIERLLAAFDQAPPAIFADGPFSDRGGSSENAFARFVELDRVNLAAWRLEILGGTAPDGSTVPSLFERITVGLDAALVARPDLDSATSEELAKLFAGQTEPWRHLMIELVTEAAFAAPEYGGNPGGAGWKMIHFPGDQLPRGYTAAQVSQADTTPDPAPLDAEIQELLATVIGVLGGRSA